MGDERNEKKIASISIILVFTIMCGCSGLSRPEGFQDVQNIVSVDYQFGDFQNFDDHYLFDLEEEFSVSLVTLIEIHLNMSLNNPMNMS